MIYCRITVGKGWSVTLWMRLFRIGTIILSISPTVPTGLGSVFVSQFALFMWIVGNFHKRNVYFLLVRKETATRKKRLPESSGPSRQQLGLLLSEFYGKFTSNRIGCILGDPGAVSGGGKKSKTGEKKISAKESQELLRSWLFFARIFFSPVLDFFPPPLTAPGSPRM